MGGGGVGRKEGNKTGRKERNVVMKERGAEERRNPNLDLNQC